MTFRRTLALSLSASTVTAGLLLGGCGVSSDGAIDELQQQNAAAQESRLNGSAGVRTSLPEAIPGVARVDGATRGSLTPLAVQAYRVAGGSTSVEVGGRSESEAYAALCSGRTDIVDGSRPISRSELVRCRDAGLAAVQLVVGADAVVVATKSGTDVGLDCLPLAGVRTIFRAGSPYFRWNQAGGADVSLQAGGPRPGTEAFDLFGHAVLGAAQPSLTDVRSDYRDAVDDRANRQFVVGSADDARVATRRDDLVAQLAADGERVRAARASQTEAIAELVAARRDQRKGVADDRSAAAKARALTRLRRASAGRERADAYVASATTDAARVRRAATAAGAAARRQARLQGRVSLFRFSTYELYEDELRPMEVSAADGARRSCVFPSADTIADGTYPLTRPLLLTTTTAGLGRAEVRSFLTSYLRQARALATGAQLVPVAQARLAEQLAWVAGTRRPVTVAEAADAAANPNPS